MNTIGLNNKVHLNRILYGNVNLNIYPKSE